MITEDFLHYVWQYKLFDFKDCKTTIQEDLSIRFSGYYNTNSGPDFLYAQLKIDHQTWVGNVEIHIKSSDWYHHHHEVDENYDAVILHVVYEHDTEIYMKNNKPLPTLVLKNLIKETDFEDYQNVIQRKTHWITCEKQLPKINNFLWNKWLEHLYFERLTQKSILIKELLTKSNNDFEAVFFKLLSKNFGLKVNGEAFLNMASSLPFSVIQKERFCENKLSALIFGQAGFLNHKTDCDYQCTLKKEYEYLQHKYQLKPVNNNQF